MKLSDYVVQKIVDQNVKHVFTLSGGGCMHLIDSVGRQKGLEYICNLHEQASAIGAEAYSQYTNNLGFCLVTTGPGGTNTVTGVAGAWLESSPVIFVSGQVKRADLKGTSGVRQLGPQEIDIVSIVKPITKYAVTIMDPKDVRYHLEKAIYLATTGRRGPVWIDVPLDVQNSQIDPSSLRGFDPAEIQTTTISQSELKQKVSQVVELLANAERPVIYFGNGVRAAQAESLLEEMIEQLKIPTLVSWKAIDMISDSSPYCIGRPGGVGQRAANFTQQNADMVLVLGTRLDLSQLAFNQKYFARAAKKVMVDIDQHEINKLGIIDVPINCDAGAFLKELKQQIIGKKLPDISPWLKRTQGWKERYPVLTRERKETKGVVSQYMMVDALSKAATPYDVLIPGSSGPCSEVFMQLFQTKKGQRVVNTQGLGSMGFGLPSSIGVCLASGRKRTICLNGDGGFQLNIQELETVKRLNLPIKFFILANGGYSSIMTTQRGFFEGRYFASEPSSGVTLPSILKLAEAYGFKTAHIADHENIVDKVKAVLDTEGPVICEVIVSPEDYTAPRAKSIMRADGTMATLPMEDLWPFLDRAEFKENMIIGMLPESQELKV